MSGVTPPDLSIQSEYSFDSSSSFAGAARSGPFQRTAKQMIMPFVARDTSRLAVSACLFACVIVGETSVSAKCLNMALLLFRCRIGGDADALVQACQARTCVVGDQPSRR